jgi:GDP-L-fucose synthase
MKILITGGSGMVGKSLKKLLPSATYLSSSDCDLTNESEVISLMTNTKFDVVIHLAAKVGGIIDNINKPDDYFTDNIQMNTNIVKWSRITGVNRFIGILSTCIYPDKVDTYPMTEDMLHQGPPTPTNFSYGYAKRCLAVHIDASNTQYGTKYQYLTPCNLYGENDKFGENSHFVAALVKKIVKMEQDGGKTLGLFGTGKPLRQFMHSDDLANIIKYCIDNDWII